MAQVPLLLLVSVIPVRFGAGQLMPDGLFPLGGVALTALGGLLVIWGFVSLGNALTPFPRPLEEASLHRQGAYRWMRHPIYTGVMLAAFGWALWWLSPAGVFFSLLLAVFFDRKAAQEEIWLRQKYANYAEYARRVKRFIPAVY